MSLFLKNFTLNKIYRGIQPFSINFNHGLNVIVGENGSGKSSIINLIINEKDKDLYNITVEKNTTFQFFDTEKENPRTKNPNLSNNFGFALNARFVSHGEAMLPILLHSQNFENTLLFVDEPESGLSLKNQKIILSTFEKAIKNNCQIILTTHSYIIINNSKEVFSLNHKQWISSQQYLKEIL